MIKLNFAPPMMWFMHKNVTHIIQSTTKGPLINRK